MSIDVTDSVLARSFAKFDNTAMGAACGVTIGLAVALATLMLVLKGGDVVGPNLSLLNQYFPGYTVSFGGAVLGLLYGGALGFAFGWVGAFFHNVSTAIYLFVVQFAANINTVTDTIDPDHSR